MSRISISKKILNQLKKLESKSPGRSINHLKVLLGLERVVARVYAHPKLSDHLVFKGGFVIAKDIESNRYTRDIDASAYMASKENLIVMIKRALSLDLSDGFWFGNTSVEEVTQEQLYPGLRFSFQFQLGEPPSSQEKLAKLSWLQFDVTFHDKIEDLPQKRKLESMISEFTPIAWRAYPIEWIFAEKLQTLVSRGDANTRAKDLYDLCFISLNMPFDKTLKETIVKTFKQRETLMPNSFQKFFEELNLGTLKSSWNSVLLSDKDFSFDGAIEKLFKIMVNLDALLT